MVQLNQEKCVACRRDSPSVTLDEKAQLHSELPQWDLIDEGGIPKLDRVFKFGNFQERWISPPKSASWPNPKDTIPGSLPSGAG